MKSVDVYERFETWITCKATYSMAVRRFFTLCLNKPKSYESGNALSVIQ